VAGLADAATDRVSVAQAPALTTWSICAWIKPAASASFQPIVRVEAGGGTAMVFGLKGLTPSLYSAASTTGINGSALTIGQYVFVAATRNGTAAALYWGTNPGSLSKVTGTVNSTGTPDTWTVWGRSPSDGSEWFSGTVDYLRTWAGTVLTDAEVAAEGASATVVKAGTWGNWPFGDNGSGGVSLSDISGNARHLTAGSTPLTLVADVSLSTTINGSGTATAQLGVSAGSGGVRVSGSGAATAQQGAGAGTGAALVQGVGAATAQLGSAAGSAGTLVQGSGAAVASPAAAAGTAGALVTGTGATSVQQGAGAGASAVLVTGSGSATAPPATSSGSSGSLIPIEGSGAAVTAPAAASGAGAVVVSGSGAAAALPATSTGVLGAVVGGDGAASAAGAAATGTGQAIITATGTAVAPAAVSAGAPPEPGSLLLEVGEGRQVAWLLAGEPEDDVVAAAGAPASVSWLVVGDGAPA
jgi:hypothetical protein